MSAIDSSMQAKGMQLQIGSDSPRLCVAGAYTCGRRRRGGSRRRSGAHPSGHDAQDRKSQEPFHSDFPLSAAPSAACNGRR